MDILKAISLLLDYPKAEVIEHMDELVGIIQNAREISPTMRGQLIELTQHLVSTDLMDLQEAYDGLFERGRALSLLLFEHVHGESRDRGQAMVDLMALYQKAGFEINVRELPDFIPLYLEFLATCEDLDAREGLADVSHILGIISARLKERESLYAHCFSAMLMVAGVEVDEQSLREQVSQEVRDDSLEAMDKIWEEEMVTFAETDPNQQCSSNQTRPRAAKTENVSPVHWVQPNQTAPAGVQKQG